MRPLRALLTLAAAASLVAVWPGAVEAAATPDGLPSCAEGPQRRGDVTLGTACDDVIHVPPGVAAVHAGGGDDTIVPKPIALASECPLGCFLGVGSQTFDGGPGDDVVYGQRGNDRLNGGEGNDRLYGGIGDDRLRGGPGNDLLAGGHGFDVIDGESGDDVVHGDGTIDEIQDSGGGFDTLSYATGVTPGFTREPEPPIAGFPPKGGERGVYLDLGEGRGDNGVATNGGGVDEINVGAGSFERVIGTPFSDYIAGTNGPETIYGGGGADAIFGNAGNDTLYGGADGDLLDGGAGEDELHPGADAGTAIGLRDTSKVSAGFETPEETTLQSLYLVGSNAADEVTVKYTPGTPPSVSFELASAAPFAPEAPGCPTPSSTALACPLAGPLDALVVAGMGGDDTLRAEGFPSSVSVLILGGAGDDSIRGGEQSEDVLVDGTGEDELEALGGDDALMNNEGADRLLGGTGNDLFLSNSLCDGDLLDGGADRDNSSWAKLEAAVEARLDGGTFGPPGNGGPHCAVGSPGQLQAVEDLEGTNQGDFLYGDGGNNQLLGRPGADTYYALAGNDSILANSGDTDLVIDCGEGPADSTLIDEAPVADPAPIECEFVNQAPPESFEPPTLPQQPSPPPPPEPKRLIDRVPPRTRITHGPPKLVITNARRRRVVFTFAASEPGSHLLCRLDRRPLAPCRSPRAYLVGHGRHHFSVVAIDAAGNRPDPGPLLLPGPVALDG